jgi:hypothetical protein
MAASATKATWVAPSTATHCASRYLEVSWCSRSQAGIPDTVGRRRTWRTPEQGGGQRRQPPDGDVRGGADHAGEQEHRYDDQLQERSRAGR